MSTLTIDVADDTLATLEEHAAREGVSVSLLLTTLADDAADQARKLRAIRRDVATADPAALRRFFDAAPDIEPEGWDRIEED